MKTEIITLNLRRPKTREEIRREKLEFSTFCLSVICTVLAVAVIAMAWLMAPVKAEEVTGAKAAVYQPDPPKAVCLAQSGPYTAPKDKPYPENPTPLTDGELEVLKEACEEFDVPVTLMLGLIERETNFRNMVGDNGNSEGYCQIQKKWWSGLMEEIGAEDLMDPTDNFRTGAAIMAKLMGTYGDTAKALVAYNQGSYKGVVSKYAKAVLANADKWKVVVKWQRFI